jgi:hypothetical protein
MNGADYRPQPGEQFDLAVCLGASWIFDGHRGTLAALQQRVQAQKMAYLRWERDTLGWALYLFQA